MLLLQLPNHSSAQRNRRAVRSHNGFTRLIRSRFILSEDGGTLVESAATMLVLLLLIFGIMDCSRALYYDHYVRYSAEEAARYAMVRGSTWSNASCTNVTSESCTATSGNVSSFVSAITPFGNSNNLAVTTTWLGTTPSGNACNSNAVYNSPGCVVQVQVAYNFNFLVPLLPKNALLLSSTSAVAISQ